MKLTRMTDDGIAHPAPSESLQPAPPTPVAPAPNLFRGPNGLRAGWRALLFLVINVALSVLLFTVLALVAKLRGSSSPRPGSMSMLTPLGLTFAEGATLLVALVSAFLMSRIERRNFGAYGLPLRFAFRRHFWIGTLVGFAAISASLLGIFAFHGFHLTAIATHGNTLVTAIAAWSVAFIVVGLSEEFVFRGYLQYTLSTGMGFWPSAIVMSILFGAAHARNPGENILGLVSVVLFGLLFCLFLRRTGNLWWAVGFHTGWDWGQTFFYGVPDSGLTPFHSLFSSVFNGPRWLTGGTVGPEASIFAPAALLIVALLFNRVYRQPAEPAAAAANVATAAGPTTL
jgi:membrane protease YdiL (CAAX protease family)